MYSIYTNPTPKKIYLHQARIFFCSSFAKKKKKMIDYKVKSFAANFAERKIKLKG